MLIAVMSLCHFIRVTTKDIQVAAAEKTGGTEPPPAKQGVTEPSKASMLGGDTEETEEETPLLRKKLSKKRGCTEGEREGEKR